jgi:hypothetical protein
MDLLFGNGISKTMGRSLKLRICRNLQFIRPDSTQNRLFGQLRRNREMAAKSFLFRSFEKKMT